MQTFHSKDLKKLTIIHNHKRQWMLCRTLQLDKKCKHLTFTLHFLGIKIIQIFLIYFSLQNNSLGVNFKNKSSFDSLNFESLYFLTRMQTYAKYLMMLVIVKDYYFLTALLNERIAKGVLLILTLFQTILRKPKQGFVLNAAIKICGN